MVSNPFFVDDAKVDRMAEVRIKIQSDPYQEKVRYYSWHGYWREITTSTNPGSGLLGERLVRGFFPFKAEEIVETISKEFGDGDRIQDRKSVV